MKNSIINSIKSLPALSRTIAEINRVCADKSTSIADLVKVIETDPMIIANLLKAASSPLYGFSREIKNVEQAVSLFGMSMTRSIAIGDSVRKLLNVDMQPYGITSEKFVKISSMQATLMYNWYKKINKKKAEVLYLAALLQETGKILIASDIIQNDETFSFKSEVEVSNNLAQLECSYVDVSASKVTALVFEHWNFDKDMIEMIKYADNPNAAPDDIKEYSIALNIVKTIIPINKPLAEQSINFGLRLADNAMYDHEILEDSVDDLLDTL
ncbi:MAG: HDOD domain-containing protein [Sulfurimonas sp.]|nr:HDOD domain-containing protein [Sulfurimonas sp.]